MEMKKSSRRTFLKETTMAAVVPVAAFTHIGTKPKTMKNILVHQVYFWLKNPGNPADRQELIEGLQKMTNIKLIKSCHIGLPAGTSRDVVDGSYAVSWLAVFKNRADQDAYQVDPTHKKFVEECSHLWSKVIVYDSVDV